MFRGRPCGHDCHHVNKWRRTELNAIAKRYGINFWGCSIEELCVNIIEYEIKNNIRNRISKLCLQYSNSDPAQKGDHNDHHDHYHNNNHNKMSQKVIILCPVQTSVRTPVQTLVQLPSRSSHQFVPLRSHEMANERDDYHCTGDYDDDIEIFYINKHFENYLFSFLED